MGVLAIDTAALERAAAAAGAAAESCDQLRATATGRLAVGAGMSGWETHASAWGYAYDRDAAQLLRGIEGLAAAYGRLRCSTQGAAALYRFTEQAAGGRASGFDQPPPPPGERCLPLPASAVGGRIPLLPDLGQLIADAAGVSWPSGDASAMRTVAGVWQDIGFETRSLAARTDAAVVQALSGLRGADVLLLRDAHGEVLACASGLADGCEALADGCKELAGAMELAHQQLVDEATAFTRDAALTLGVSMLLAPFSAGLSVWICSAAGAARLAAAVSVFRSVVGALGAAAARAGSTGAVAMARAGAAAQRVRGVAGSATAIAARGIAAIATRTKAAYASESIAAARTLARRHGDSVLGVLASGPDSLVLQLAGQAAQRRLTAQLAPRLLSPTPVRSPLFSFLQPAKVAPFVLSVFTAYNWAQRAGSTWTLAAKDSWLKQVLGAGGGTAMAPGQDRRPLPPRPEEPRPGPGRKVPPLSHGPLPVPPRNPPGQAPSSAESRISPDRARTGPRVVPPGNTSTNRPSTRGAKAFVPPRTVSPPCAAPPAAGMWERVSRLQGAGPREQESRGTCPSPTSSPDRRTDGSAQSR